MDERYSRQVLFSGIGPEGQAALRRARVVVVGCGALGSVGSEMLVRAGLGSLRIVDRDFLELSNLQRQSLFTEADVESGIPKAIAAEHALKKINSEVEIRGLVEDLDFRNIEELLGGADLVLDGADNFEVRYLVNDFCVKHGMPWVYGAAVGSYGLAMAVVPGETSCLRCLFPDPPSPGSSETCDTAGILASIIHVISAFQVAQTMRILTGQQPSDGLLTVDVWRDDWRRVSVRGPAEACPSCGENRFDFLDGRGSASTTSLCGRNAVQIKSAKSEDIDLTQLARRLEGTVPVHLSPYLLQIRPGPFEIALFPDGRAIVKGTGDPSEARALYARYVGN
jgi:molybdopterin/thiamine biosynthesis adenylyltransferase